MAREVVSSKQALAIAKSIKSMLTELEKESTNHLLKIVPDDEKDSLFIQINQSKTNKMLIDIQLFNSLTKTIAVKSYTIIDLLRSCGDIFSLSSMVKDNMEKLYSVSKQKIYSENTIIYV